MQIYLRVCICTHGLMLTYEADDSDVHLELMPMGHTSAHTEKMVKMEKQSLGCGKAVERRVCSKGMSPTMGKKG